MMRSHQYQYQCPGLDFSLSGAGEGVLALQFRSSRHSSRDLRISTHQHPSLWRWEGAALGREATEGVRKSLTFPVCAFLPLLSPIPPHAGTRAHMHILSPCSGVNQT